MERNPEAMERFRSDCIHAESEFPDLFYILRRGPVTHLAVETLREEAQRLVNACDRVLAAER